MKKIFLYITLATALVSCNNDLETEGLSRITYYPTFELEGGNLVLYNVGDTYAEPGIKVTEEGAEIPFTTTGTVDTSVPGFYPITYSAVNKDGFSGSETRTVVVLEPNLPELDIEGAWVSNTNAFGGESLGQEMTVTKVADGVYSASDCYAHPDLDIPIRFLINADGTATVEPIPNSPFGLPLTGVIVFDVPNGGDIPFPDGTVQSSPVAADMAIGILLGDDTYRPKTWLKE